MRLDMRLRSGSIAWSNFIPLSLVLAVLGMPAVVLGSPAYVGHVAAANAATPIASYRFDFGDGTAPVPAGGRACTSSCSPTQRARPAAGSPM